MFPKWLGTGTAVFQTISAVYRQTGQIFNTRIKTRIDFFLKFEKRMLGQKKPKVDAASVLLILPPLSAVSRQTGQIFNTTVKTWIEGLEKFVF